MFFLVMGKHFFEKMIANASFPALILTIQSTLVNVASSTIAQRTANAIGRASLRRRVVVKIVCKLDRPQGACHRQQSLEVMAASA